MSNVSNVSEEDFEIFLLQNKIKNVLACSQQAPVLVPNVPGRVVRTLESDCSSQCISRLVQLLLCGEGAHFHVYDEQKRYGIQYRVHVLN